MRVLIPVINVILPSLIFFMTYNFWGIIPAITVSGIFCALNILKSAICKEVKNTQVLGFLGLISSAIAIYFTGEEKYYYIPSFIENIIFLGFMVSLCFRHKSVLHYIAKDFEIDSLKKIPEDQLMNVNAVWLVFFSLKIIVKIIGILYLDFKTLYWLVFILGDPMTVAAIALSVVLLRKSMAMTEDME